MCDFTDMVLDLENKCSHCKSHVSAGDLLQCVDCSTAFHVKCPELRQNEKPCTDTFLGLYYQKSTKKPNFTWRCDQCATDKDTAEKVILSQRVEQITRNVVSLTSVINDIATKVDTLSSANTLLPGNPTIGNTSPNPWDNRDTVQRIRSSLKESIMVKPRDTGKPDIKKIEKIVDENNLHVHSIGVSHVGNTIINCSAESAKTLQEKLKEDDEIKHHDIQPLQELLPSISIVGVTATEWETAAKETQERYDTFTQKLRDKNDFLDTLITQGETFKILFMKPPGGKYANYQIVARVSPTVRDAIHAKYNRLFIRAISVRIHDRFYVKRCFKCNGFGHYTAGCKSTDVSCGICSENTHESINCPHKLQQGTTHHKCINCKKAGNPAYIDHNAAYHKCPAYLAAQKKLKLNISYYQGKNGPLAPRH